jgi:hypothetical protein
MINFTIKAQEERPNGHTCIRFIKRPSKEEKLKPMKQTFLFSSRMAETYKKRMRKVKIGDRVFESLASASLFAGMTAAGLRERIKRTGKLKDGTEVTFTT